MKFVKKEFKEAFAFTETLSDEVMEAAWKAGFFVMADVEGFEEFLILCLDKKTMKSWKDYLIRLKTFVAGYKNKSVGQVN